MSERSRVLRFDCFELKVGDRQLYRQGIKIKLPEQSVRILTILAEHQGELVTREEIRSQLWSEDTIVEFENSINAAIQRLRRALGDSPREPRFIETLARRGYRFLEPVEVVVRSPFETLENSLTGPDVVPVAASTTDSLLVTQLPSVQSNDHPPNSKASPIVKRLSGIAILIIVIAVAVTAFNWITKGKASTASDVVQLTHFGRAHISGRVLSDGARIYFIERTRTESKLDEISIVGGEPSRVATAFQYTSLFDISRDRSSLLIGGSDTAMGLQPLWVLPVIGAIPRRVGNLMVSGAAWSPDARRIVFTADNYLRISNSDGTDVKDIAKLAGWLQEPRWSPDGKLLRFSVRDSSNGAFAIWQADADGNNLHPLTSLSHNGTSYAGNWSPDSAYFAYTVPSKSQLNSLWAVLEKPKFPWWKPKPVPFYKAPFTLGGGFGFEPQGSHVYVVGEENRREMFVYDRAQGKLTPFLSGLSLRNVTFSPDGEWVAYELFPRYEIWRSHLDGSQALQLSPESRRAYEPHWSPDGKSILFGGDDLQGATRIYRISPDGGGLEALTEPNEKPVLGGWSPNGESVVYAAASRTSSSVIKVLDLHTKKEMQLPQSEEMEVPRWSPDGRYLVALADLGHKVAHRIKRFDFKTQLWIDLAGGGDFRTICWSQDSQYVYFWDDLHGSELFKISVGGGEPEQVTKLASLLPQNVVDASLAAVMPNGAPVLQLSRSNADIYSIELHLP